MVDSKVRTFCVEGQPRVPLLPQAAAPTATHCHCLPRSEGPQLTSLAPEAARMQGLPFPPAKQELGALLRELCDVCSSPP